MMQPSGVIAIINCMLSNFIMLESFSVLWRGYRYLQQVNQKLNAVTWVMQALL